MRPHLLSAIAFLFFQLGWCQIQSGTVIYNIRLRENPGKSTKEIKDESVKAAVGQATLELKKTIPYITCKLTFNKNEALFKKEKTMRHDNGMDLNRTFRIVAGHGGLYYTNLKEGIRLQQFKSLDEELILARTMDGLKWHITEETKVIKGYRCRKAWTMAQINADHKGKITAWFAPEIPFQFGPLEFAGLPGLILGLQRSHFYFYPKKINLSQEKRSLKKPSQGKMKTAEEYYEKIRELVRERGF